MASAEVGKLNEQDYRTAKGLNYSSMRDLAISPLRFWWLHLSPDAPVIEPTPEMQIGSALHCKVLEPEEFENRYASEIEAADFPGCLSTMDDLRGWLNEQGIKPKGTRKADLIAQVQSVNPEWPIFDVLADAHYAKVRDKVLFGRDDWQRIERMADALLSEPHVKAILAQGEAEKPYFATDPETGVLLKSRLDFVAPGLIVDVKTFSQKRGKSIDKSIHDAIWYEGYHRQAWMYSHIRQIAEGGKPCPVLLAFVESDEPHEVRIRVLRPGHLYWDRARIEVRGLIALYATYMEQFGTEKPWRCVQGMAELEDEDLPGLAYN